MIEISKIKIPEFHYLGLTNQKDGKIPRGFITPYATTKAGNPDSATRKKMNTIDRWVGFQGYKSRETLKTHVIQNKPITGFKISSPFEKDGNLWESSNEVWRIEDPRGFELEITLTNIVEIMSNTTIHKGEILCPCVWVRHHSDNFLISTNSEIYQKAIKHTKTLKQNISTKSLKPGNVVKLHNGVKGVYLGAYYTLSCGKYIPEQPPIELTYEGPGKQFDWSKTKRHFLLVSVKDRNMWGFRDNAKYIYTMSSLKVAEIISKGSQKNPTDMLAKINGNFPQIFDGRFNQIREIFALSESKDNDIQLTEIPSTWDYIKEKYGGYRSRRLLLLNIKSHDITLNSDETSDIRHNTEEFNNMCTGIVYDKAKLFGPEQKIIYNQVKSQDLRYSNYSSRYSNQREVTSKTIEENIPNFLEVEFTDKISGKVYKVFV